MMPKKMFVPMALLLVTLFMWGLAEGHGTHLSDMGEQTNIIVQPCPELGGYLVQSDQQECYIIYKHKDLVHSGLHVQAVKLNTDTACECPEVGE